MTKINIQTQNPTTTDKKVIQNPDVKIIQTTASEKRFIKPTKTINIAITGANGLVGSNLLFEILNMQSSDIENTRLFLLGRNKEEETFKERINNLFFNDSFQYLKFGENKSQQIKEFLTSIHYIDFELTSDNLGIDSVNFSKFHGHKIDCFIHVAASTDIRCASSIGDAVLKTNHQGIKKILQLVKQLKVKQFYYISTSFINSSTSGVIAPDLLNLNQDFNNPYEKSKAMSENEVINYCNENKISFKIFRPSLVAGRLIDGPIGAVNKFDVFYAYGRWLTYIKLKEFNSLEKVYEKPLKIDFTPPYEKNGIVNIVPVDFVAKFILQTFLQDSQEQFFNVVNPINTRNSFYVPLMDSLLNIECIYENKSKNKPKNTYALLYDKLIGFSYKKYTELVIQKFDLTSTIDICRKADLKCPRITIENFTKIVDFAKTKHFGLRTN